MTRIAIIGAGLSGRLLALNLSREASSAVSILMIDRGDPHYMGPAYSDGRSEGELVQTIGLPPTRVVRKLRH
jgi:uncharacterized NAD(P)/FAD-binding protein YdhS